MKNHIPLLMIIFFFILTLTACKSTEERDRPLVVATTTYVGDMVSQIGGPYVNVKTLIGPGLDPHDYQPRQSDTESMLQADLIVINGLDLEERFGEVLQNLQNKTVLVLGDHVADRDLIYEAPGVPDPHIWFDPAIWSALASVVADALADIDPDHAAAYHARAEQYVSDIALFVSYAQARVDTLPEAQRILVTAHDAFEYFGRAFGFELHAVQGISTSDEASIADIQDLAHLVAQLNVPAIFVESTLPTTTIQAVIEAANALGHTVIIGGELFSDSAGTVATGTETYLRAYRHNIDTIINALLP